MSTKIKNWTKQQELTYALAKLAAVFLEGKNYDTQNPYLRTEVKDALKVLARHYGYKSYLDVDLYKIMRYLVND